MLNGTYKMLMKTHSRQLALFSFLIILFAGCNRTIDHKQAVRELLDVDLKFAERSMVTGSHSAFLEYIDDSCVLLRPKRMPVIGRDKIVEMFSSPDTSFTLNWSPSFAEVSESADLGYTYGIYTVQMDSPDGSRVTKQGTYVTIWKKNKNGEWKFVLDTGNQGIGPINGESKE
jgi:ketosteroid isomerase-like protein